MILKRFAAIFCALVFLAFKPVITQLNDSESCFLNDVNKCVPQKDWELKLDASFNSFLNSDSINGGLDMSFLHNEALALFKQSGFKPIKRELIDSLEKICIGFIEKLGPVKQVLSYRLVRSGEFMSSQDIVLVRFEGLKLYFESSNINKGAQLIGGIETVEPISLTEKLKKINFRFNKEDAFYDGYLIVSQYSFQNHEMFVNYSVAPNDHLINTIKSTLFNFETEDNIESLMKFGCK